jgi:outer membrane protein TolC
MTHRFRWMLSIALALLATAPLTAQVPEPVDFDQALGAGRALGTRAVVARLDARLADATAAAHRSSLYPTVTGGLSADRQTMNLDEFGFPGVSGVTDPFTVLRARVTAQQVLFDPAAWAGMSAARDSLVAAGADVDRVADQSAIDAGVAWIRLAGAEERVRARLADSVTDQELLDVASDRVAAGTAAKIERTRSQTRQAVTQAALSAARHDVERARIDLARAMGLPASARLITRGEPEFSFALPPAGDSAVSLARTHRPDRQAALLRVAVAERRLRSETLTWWPRLVAGGFVQQSGQQLRGLSGSWNLSLALAWTPFDGFRRQRDADAARIRVDLARARLADIDAAVAADARRAVIDVAAAGEQVGIATDRLALASEELHEAEERLAAGVAGSVETTTAQAGVAAARDALIQARMSLGAARLAALGAIGMLDPHHSEPVATGETLR